MHEGLSSRISTNAAALDLRSSAPIGSSLAPSCSKNGVGREVDDRDLLDLPGMVRTFTVANPAVVGKPLEEIAQWRDARGVFLRRIRLGQEIPNLPGATLNRGDEVELLGTERAIQRFAGTVGVAHRSDAARDLAAIGIAIFCGGLIGAPFLLVHGFRLSLATAVGAQVVGIVLGWLHSVRPTLGAFPRPPVPS